MQTWARGQKLKENTRTLEKGGYCTYLSGNILNCENYRGIKFLCQCLNIYYEKLILRKTESKLEQTAKEQYGF